MHFFKYKIDNIGLDKRARGIRSHPGQDQNAKSNKKRLF